MTVSPGLDAFLPLQIDAHFTLRAVELEDAESLAAFVEGNREHLARFLPDLVAEIVELATARAHLERVIELRDRDSLLEMHLLEGGSLCGAARLRNIDWQYRSGNVGYLLGSAHQGRGIITRTVLRFLEWTFSELGLHRVELRCEDGNTASAAGAGRLGFTHAGVARDGEDLGDRYRDILVFSRLSSDGQT